MALRNFWIDSRIDGRNTILSGGPRSKDGGMHINVLQRKDGKKVKAVEVNCYEENGQLITCVWVGNEKVGEFVTDR